MYQRGITILFILFLAAPNRLWAQIHYPILQIEPTMNTAPIPNAVPFRDACLNPGAWPTGWDRTDFFGNAHQMMATLTDAELAQCFWNIRSAGKRLVVATGALKPHCTTAAACWDGVVPNFRRFRDLGGTADYLEIDEPLTTGQQPMDYWYAVQQTAEFIRLARSEPGLGSMQVILQEAYPAQSAATLGAFYRDVNNETIVRTGWGIQYAQIDHDWNAGGNVSDLVSIQNSVRTAGMNFGIIFWAAGSWGWYDGLMQEGEMYRNMRRSGLAPDMYAVINWTGNPTTTLAEWDGTSTFTRSVRDFSLTYTPTPSGFGLRPDEVLYPDQTRTSADGRFTLIYQSDGNLVLYRDSQPLWHSGTWGFSPGEAVMQGDGNLVVYDGGGYPRWASGTSGYNGSYLVVQSDGNLVIYNSVHPIWSTNTNWY